MKNWFLKGYTEKFSGISLILFFASQLFIRMDFPSLPIAADFILFALCIPLIICKWVCMKEFLFIDKLSATVTVIAAAFFALFFKYKIAILADIIMFILILAFTSIAPRMYKKEGKPEFELFDVTFWVLMYITILLSSLFRCLMYSFTESVFIPFLPAAIITGVLFGTLTTCLTLKKRLTKDVRIKVFLLSSLLVAFVAWPFTAHLNYALDTSDPAQYYIKIQDKELSRKWRLPDSYEFEFTVNDKTFSVDVPSSDYGKYEVGDTYLLYRYEGAFGVPFFITGNYTD